MAYDENRVMQNKVGNRIADALINIGDALGAYSAPLSWGAILNKIRAGTIENYVQPGDPLEVKSSYLVTLETNDGREANVTSTTFLSKTGSVSGAWEFTYSGSVWNLDGAAVNLEDYGITPSGTPASGDTITVSVSAASVDFDVEGIDEECPVNPLHKHCLSIMMHDILSTINFDPPQYLFPVTAESLAAIGISGNELPAGTYNITLNKGAYNNTTAQDGTYCFTITKPVPIGGGIRHTQMGAYRADGTYTAANLLTGTFTTYAADTITVIESNLTTSAYSEGTSLGTTSAEDITLRSHEYINLTRRQAHGSNRWSTSYIRQLLNSDDEVLQWKPMTIFSRNISAKPEGYLHSIDRELRAVLTKVRKRYALHSADGGGYEDIEDYVTLATMLDVFGSKNGTVTEGPVDAEGNVTRTTAMTLWKDSTNADRVKTQKGTARDWWLASALPSGSLSSRLVYPSGALGSSGASNALGAVPCLHIA